MLSFPSPSFVLHRQKHRVGNPRKTRESLTGGSRKSTHLFLSTGPPLLYIYLTSLVTLPRTVQKGNLLIKRRGQQHNFWTMGCRQRPIHSVITGERPGSRRDGGP